jgi:serine O-acetyltransferase
MNTIIASDLYRINKRSGYYDLIKTAFKDLGFRYLLFFRLLQKSRFKLFYKLILRRTAFHSGIKIGYEAQIGRGLIIVHWGDIDINSDSIIGENCNITQGVTIGITNRGEKRGCPVIGNNVWIGTNAVIVGHIHVGNNVLIAPLSYVNVDVPDNSIVIGNPAKIISKANATEGYIENTLN